jgi:hypothetical protein
LEPLKTALPQDAETQATFNNLQSEVTTTIRDAELFALEDLLQLNATLLQVLPAYIGLEDKLEMAIEAAQRHLGLPVVPASKINFLNYLKFHENILISAPINASE